MMDRPFTHNDGVPAYNGSGQGAHPPFHNEPVGAYAQGPAPSRNMKKGIDEKGIDEDVHDFANNMPEVPRLSYPRSEAPHAYNGSGPKAHPAFHNEPIGSYMQRRTAPNPQQRKKKDIAEPGMDEEVHGFANSMVEPIAWPRKQEPYAPNGSGPKAFPPAPEVSTPALMQRRTAP